MKRDNSDQYGVMAMTGGRERPDSASCDPSACGPQTHNAQSQNRDWQLRCWTLPDHGAGMNPVCANYCSPALAPASWVYEFEVVLFRAAMSTVITSNSGTSFGCGTGGRSQPGSASTICSHPIVEK